MIKFDQVHIRILCSVKPLQASSVVQNIDVLYKMCGMLAVWHSKSELFRAPTFNLWNLGWWKLIHFECKGNCSILLRLWWVRLSTSTKSWRMAQQIYHWLFKERPTMSTCLLAEAKYVKAFQAVIHSDSSDRVLDIVWWLFWRLYFHIVIIICLIYSDPSLHKIVVELRTWSKPTVNQSWLNLTGHALDLDGNPTDEGWTQQTTVHPELRCACPLGDTMDWETMHDLNTFHSTWRYDVWMHLNLDTSGLDFFL